MMKKTMISYLNVGCGNKFHKNWVNIDMNATSSEVLKCNFLNGLPFEDERFDVLYHSQVLEHIPKENALKFIKECYRVLNTNGLIRIVVPDLENIIDEYRKCLLACLANPDDVNNANYDWIMLELYDQVVRNSNGGEMAKYLSKDQLLNEQFVIDRVGHSSLSLRNGVKVENILKKNYRILGLFGLFKKILNYAKQKFFGLILGEKYRIGNFRLGGEVHMWMYDKFSLSRLLKEAGFNNIKIKNAFDSDIPNWGSYKLDVCDGKIYDPTSLFIEATK